MVRHTLSGLINCAAALLNISPATGQNVAAIWSSDPNLTYDVKSMFDGWVDEFSACDLVTIRY